MNTSTKLAAPRKVVQEALQVTWLLKGHLKNAQLAYIRVGVLLARVRDEKLYVALRHPDLESYAEQRLHLGRASLYRYMQVHDWVATSHPEWLQPKPQGFIPSLADAAGLIWIEGALAKRGLDPKRRAALEVLRQIRARWQPDAGGAQRVPQAGALGRGQLEVLPGRLAPASQAWRGPRYPAGRGSGTPDQIGDHDNLRVIFYVGKEVETGSMPVIWILAVRQKKRDDFTSANLETFKARKKIVLARFYSLAPPR